MAENEQNDEKQTEDEYYEEEPQDETEEQDGVERSKMPLTAHLDELRKRLFYSILAVVLISVVAFIFIEPIFSIIQRPFQQTVNIEVPLNEISDLADKVRANLDTVQCDGDLCLTDTEKDAMARMVELNLRMLSGLIFTHPVEGFITFIKLAFYTGLILGMPFLMIQLWRFVIPALYPNEKGFFKYFLAFGSSLFYLGVVFCYWAVLPIGIGFLVGFGGDLLTPLFSLGNYVSFSMLMMLVFGLAFEVPLAMFILVKMGLVQRESFFQYWRHIMVGAVVVGAVFTPPDVMTQLLMGGAVVVLYGVGLFVTRFAVPKAEEEDIDEIESI